MNIVVQADKPVQVDPNKGQSQVWVNASATDVYYSEDYQRLANTPTGAVPNGAKLPAGQTVMFPASTRPLFARAAVQTNIEVIPG